MELTLLALILDLKTQPEWYFVDLSQMTNCPSLCPDSFIPSSLKELFSLSRTQPPPRAVVFFRYLSNIYPSLVAMIHPPFLSLSHLPVSTVRKSFCSQCIASYTYHCFLQMGLVIFWSDELQNIINSKLSNTQKHYYSGLYRVRFPPVTGHTVFINQHIISLSACLCLKATCLIHVFNMKCWTIRKQHYNSCLKGGHLTQAFP